MNNGYSVDVSPPIKSGNTIAERAESQNKVIQKSVSHDVSLPRELIADERPRSNSISSVNSDDTLPSSGSQNWVDAFVYVRTPRSHGGSPQVLAVYPEKV
jgi:hypothetical protein